MGNIIQKFPKALKTLKNPYSLLSGAHLSDSFIEDIEFKLVAGYPEDMSLENYFCNRFSTLGFHSIGMSFIIR